MPYVYLLSLEFKAPLIIIRFQIIRCKSLKIEKFVPVRRSPDEAIALKLIRAFGRSTTGVINKQDGRLGR